MKRIVSNKEAELNSSRPVLWSTGRDGEIFTILSYVDPNGRLR